MIPREKDSVRSLASLYTHGEIEEDARIPITGGTEAMEGKRSRDEYWA